jgi:hypothetical protein
MIEEVHGRYYSLRSRENLNSQDASIMICQYLASDLNEEPLQTMRQVHEMVVTWESVNSESKKPIEWMEGYKYEERARPTDGPYAYRFRDLDGMVGALVVVTSQPIEHRKSIPRRGLESLINSSRSQHYGGIRRSNKDLRVSRATWDYANMEIGDGEVIPEHAEGPAWVGHSVPRPLHSLAAKASTLLYRLFPRHESPQKKNSHVSGRAGRPQGIRSSGHEP